MGTRVLGQRNSKFTTQEIIDWCLPHKIKFLDVEYIGNNYKHNWLCLKHNTQTIQMFAKIKIKNQLSCCARDSVRCLSQIENFTKQNNITLVDKYIGSSQENIWRCNIHDQEFKHNFFTLRQLKDKRLPCCIETDGYMKTISGHQQYTIKQVKELSLEKGYEFVDSVYNGIATAHKWRCIKHNQIRTTTFNSIHNHNRPLKCCHTAFYSGPNHPSYNKNVSEETRVKNRHYGKSVSWSLDVRKRDNFMCKRCKKKANYKKVKLHAHHILPYLQYPEHRYNIDNGITLCQPCHIAFHKQYGKENNNQEQINEFLLLG